ncbi:Sphingoid long-chain base transporter RSB1 [Candida viswanathii]|uniref:Sphingoid long-chain base transporter RSB1 n=1 Tax=Candida viswanathii TaxID=5486 RepID=A0A367YM11_9ASCO|nr:Sphingoid long-chain base transporter RSB1 [Candida viswanathii]
MDDITKYISSWTPTSIPSTTTLSSIAQTHAPELYETLMSVYSRAVTEKDWVNLRSLSQAYRGAQASLTIISAEQVLATATDPSVQAQATEEIFYATLNLDSLAYLRNLYKYYLSRPANIIYLVIYFLLFAYFTGMSIKSRYWWYNVTFVCGYGLEFIGFLGRVLAFTDDTRMQFYLMQIVCLTIAPAFIMAGVYFLFGQLVVIHGRQYSRLKPLWYSYFFIATDVISLLIQAGGGGAASVASNNHTDTRPGTNTMIAGIAAQVFAMTVFLFFWFEFLGRIYFKNSRVEPTDSPLARKSVANYFKLLLNLRSVRQYRHAHLDKFYNPKFALIRQNKLFDYMPLAMTVAVVVVYIRCIYRVVELAEGFGGYLYSHEPYLMVLDACMIAIAGIIFVPFHPYWVFGKENVVKLATIKKNQDEHHEEKDVIEEISEENSKS